MTAPQVVVLAPEQLQELVAEAVASALAERANDNGGLVLLTQEQLAHRLGVSTRTVYTMRERGCPVVYVLESPRFELAAVLAWLRERGRDA